MALNPEGHSSLWDTRTLLPIGKLEVTAHESVLSSTNNGYDLLHETELIRAMEGAYSYYMGMMAGEITGGVVGIAYRPGWSSFSTVNSTTIAHELGHNLNLQHAPCGGPAMLDPSFPAADGSVGTWQSVVKVPRAPRPFLRPPDKARFGCIPGVCARIATPSAGMQGRSNAVMTFATGCWGYDFRIGGRLVPPIWPDLMSYCNLRDSKWISDYHFTNALRYRLPTVARGELPSLVAAPAKSLVLWGGVGAGGAPFLEPAFVVEAPASLPRSTGTHEIHGRTAAGDELFSLSFEMPEVADGGGRSSFAFVLPVQPEWADQLASITLSGPGGSVTLDQETDRPVTILRNPATGRIRGILRDVTLAALIRGNTASALSLDPGLERLTSRGIPAPEDWTR